MLKAIRSFYPKSLFKVLGLDKELLLISIKVVWPLFCTKHLACLFLKAFTELT